MHEHLIQIVIVTAYQGGLGIDDVFQHARTGIIPVARVAVILHESPAALGIKVSGTVSYQQRDVEVAEERDQTVTLDAAALKELDSTTGCILLIPEEADVTLEQDIRLQQDEATRYEFPELLDREHVLDAGPVGDAVVFDLLIRVLGQLSVKINKLTLGVINTTHALHLLGERTLVAVIKYHDGIVLCTLLAQGEDCRLGELGGVEVDYGYGLTHVYSGATSATRVLLSLVTRRSELLE